MRTFFLYATVGLLIFSCFIPVSTSAIPDLKEQDSRYGLFGLQSYLELSWNKNDTTRPIIPRGGLRIVPLEITFGINEGPLGEYILPFFYGREIQIHLKVGGYPEWCDVVMKSGAIVTAISREVQHLRSLFTVQLDMNAPAFQEFVVEVEASVDNITGPFGVINFINGCKTEGYPCFQPDYLPLINADCPYGNTIKAPPGLTATLTFRVTNLGNGETRVLNEFAEIPDGDWNISMPDEILLDVGEHGLVNISIRPPYVSGQSYVENIRVRLTPQYAYNSSISGYGFYITFLVYYFP
jgi:hypothetical protein